MNNLRFPNPTRPTTTPPPTTKTPVRGEAVAEARASVDVRAQGDFQQLQQVVRDVFSPAQLTQPGSLASRLPPSLQALLAPTPTSKSPRPDPSHLEATLENVSRILQDGCVGESEIAAVARTNARINDVLALAPHVAMLPTQVRERVESMLLGPLARLRDGLAGAQGATIGNVADRDSAALREVLKNPRPRVQTLDVTTTNPASTNPPSFASMDRFAVGDLVLVPRSSGPASLGVVVGRDADGLRVEVDGPSGFGLKTLTQAQLASANPFRIGDVFHAEGKEMHVHGANADGTLRIVPYDRAHPDHVVFSRGGSFAGDVAARLVEAQTTAQATPTTTPKQTATTNPAHYARTGNNVVGNYLHNGIEASQLFADRFGALSTSKKPLDGSALLALCADMHQVACLGSGGDRPYTSGHYSTDQVHPGHLRTGGGAMSNRARAGQYADAVVKLLKLPPLQDGAIAVRGLSDPTVLPHSFVNGMHFYPDSKTMPAYFEAAAAQLETLRKLPAVPAGGKANGAVVDVIADAYHTLANARPFEQVNNSMFMGQVNVLLQRFGHAPMSHGYIDHLAHRLSVDSFRAVFRAHLDGKLPLPDQLGIDRF